MKRCETLAELVARTVVEFEQRELELQKAQVHQVKPQEKATKQRKSNQVAYTISPKI
ncbi:MAG: hypothetical protein RMX68_025140 [Aulosira sp. ZfuVER01]|nr:hypothetical protein [Aulosira sp. ZfuVER01]MDZ7999400.1 hypothetical protein [Aulosira sp. DedVER01a]MDZ8055415.1 hypothetical protein [Aulosira sp. ZfuCHP01]